MNAKWAKLLSALIYLYSLTLIVACDSGPGSLPASQRSIAAELPADQRQALRKLPFEGARNFRDLGGYPTSDGRQVKWGLIYRSDSLANLTPEDRLYLERLGLTRIVDFRTEDERNAEPSKIAAGSSIKLENLPIAVSDTDLTAIKQKNGLESFAKEDSRRLMISANRSLVENYTLVYRAWINSFSQKNATPMLFQSSAGKDRAGFAAAIILLALGVPEQFVMEDYMATNRYTADRTQQKLLFIKAASLFQVDTETLQPLFRVEPSFLQEALNCIKEHYGSIENYLEKGLGLDAEKRQQLRDLLTEPA